MKLRLFTFLVTIICLNSIMKTDGNSTSKIKSKKLSILNIFKTGIMKPEVGSENNIKILEQMHLSKKSKGKKKSKNTPDKLNIDKYEIEKNNENNSNIGQDQTNEKSDHNNIEKNNNASNLSSTKENLKELDKKFLYKSKPITNFVPGAENFEILSDPAIDNNLISLNTMQPNLSDEILDTNKEEIIKQDKRNASDKLENSQENNPPLKSNYNKIENIVELPNDDINQILSNGLSTSNDEKDKEIKKLKQVKSKNRREIKNQAKLNSQSIKKQNKFSQKTPINSKKLKNREKRIRKTLKRKDKMIKNLRKRNLKKKKKSKKNKVQKKKKSLKKKKNQNVKSLRKKIIPNYEENVIHLPKNNYMENDFKVKKNHANFNKKSSILRLKRRMKKRNITHHSQPLSKNFKKAFKNNFKNYKNFNSRKKKKVTIKSKIGKSRPINNRYRLQNQPKVSLASSFNKKWKKLNRLRNLSKQSKYLFEKEVKQLKKRVEFLAIMNKKLLNTITCPHKLEIKKNKLSNKMISFIHKFDKKINDINNNEYRNTYIAREDLSNYNKIYNSLEDQFIGLDKMINENKIYNDNE